MNNMIIRVCEIALGALSELQMEAEVKFRQEMQEKYKTKIPESVTIINREHMQLNRKLQYIEHRKLEVKQLLEIAYVSDFVKRGAK